MFLFAATKVHIRLSAEFLSLIDLQRMLKDAQP